MLTEQGKQAIRQRQLAYIELGASIADQVPELAYDTFSHRTHHPTDAEREFYRLLEHIVAVDSEMGRALDTAYCEICADLQEESFLTGFHAGVHAAKAGAR